MIFDRDILMTGLQCIDFRLGSNAVNLAYEFSKKNRVLYINYPLDRLTLLKKNQTPGLNKRLDIIRKKSPALVKISDNLYTLYPDVILESINQIPFKRIFNYLNQINNRRLAKPIQQAVRDLGFKNIIWFNDSDFYRVFHLREYLDIAISIYYSRDNMVCTPYFRRHGERMEGDMMRKADVIVTNSPYLQQAASRYNPDSYFVGQGCDVSAFDRLKIKTIPGDLSSIQKPVIGYIGALFSSRLDIDLLTYIARQRPSWNIVLVGPEDKAFKKSSLHALPNVRFLGSKKQDELPGYLAGFDVAINPQHVNPLTIGNYPRKIDEYLAMGKPVVATYTEAMQLFDDYVYLAKNKEEFVQRISQAMTENIPSLEQQREFFARQHTWEANTNEIYKVIENIMLKKQSN